MIGVELDRPCTELVKQALDAGLVINVTADNVIRLLPPLVMSEAEGGRSSSGWRRWSRLSSTSAPPPEAAMRLRHFLQFNDLAREEHEYCSRAPNGSKRSSSATSATGRWRTARSP